jgi:hypothetical protein
MSIIILIILYDTYSLQYFIPGFQRVVLNVALNVVVKRENTSSSESNSNISSQWNDWQIYADTRPLL